LRKGKFAGKAQRQGEEKMCSIFYSRLNALPATFNFCKLLSP